MLDVVVEKIFKFEREETEVNHREEEVKEKITEI